MTELLRGAGYFIRGLGLIWRPRIRTWAFLPMVVSAVLYGGLFWAATTQIEEAFVWLEDQVPSWLAWLGWVMWAAFWTIAAGVLTFTYVLVASVVASPFNGPLAEVTERVLTGRGPPGTPWYRSVVGIPRILIQETKKVLYALIWAIPFLILLAIPGVNVVGAVLWILFNAWVTALAFTDYAMDNHQLRFREMRRRLRGRLALSLGFGGAAFGALMVPGLNILAVPAAVCGGTALWVEVLAPAP